MVLAKAVTSLDLPVAIINLKEYDPDDNLIGEVGKCLFLFSESPHICGRRDEKSSCGSCRGPGSLPSTHTGWLTAARNSSSGECDVLFWLPWMCDKDLEFRFH